MSRTFEALRKALGFRGRSTRSETATELSERGITPWTHIGEGSAGAAEGYHLGPDHGVRVSPVPVVAGDRVRIAYEGLLAKEGAQSLYVRCGEGPGDWRNVRDIPMERSGDEGAWFAEVRAGDPGTLEFCFHDGAQHWDNNSGRNWSVTVHPRRTDAQGQPVKSP